MVAAVVPVASEGGRACIVSPNPSYTNCACPDGSYRRRYHPMMAYRQRRNSSRRAVLTGLPPTWGAPKNWPSRPTSWGQSGYILRDLQTGVDADGKPWTITVRRADQDLYPESVEPLFLAFQVCWYLARWLVQYCFVKRDKRWRLSVFLLPAGECWSFSQAGLTEWFPTRALAAERAQHWQASIAKLAQPVGDVDRARNETTHPHTIPSANQKFESNAADDRTNPH